MDVFLKVFDKSINQRVIDAVLMADNAQFTADIIADGDIDDFVINRRVKGGVVKNDAGGQGNGDIFAD